MSFPPAWSNLTRAEYYRLMLGADLIDLDDEPLPEVRAHAVDPHPIHATGRVRQCWSNAMAFCRTDLARYGYMEGVVRGGPGGEVDGWEMHGYVLDRSMGHVIETTTGYAEATEYRGAELDLSAVDRWFTAHPEEDQAERSSVLWLKIMLALMDGEPPELDAVACQGARPPR